MSDINKAGLLLVRDDRFLLCRKKDDTSKLIMPGGSIEPGESDEECLVREVREELGNEVRLGPLQFIGTYQDRAAYDDPTINKTVQIILYQGEFTGEMTPSSEIRELIWFDSTLDRNELSPIIKNKILPDLLSRKILTW